MGNNKITNLSTEHLEETISTFKELMDLIAYDWGFDRSELTRHEDSDGVTFQINKTYIGPTLVSYKTSNYKITNPIVFQKLEQFYQLLQTTDGERVLFQEPSSS